MTKSDSQKKGFILVSGSRGRARNGGRGRVAGIWTRIDQISTAPWKQKEDT